MVRSPRALALAIAAALASLAVTAGCGGPEARIRYLAGGPDDTVRYDTATFQLARDDKVQVVLFRRTAAPIGTADPDFEYVILELPERRRYGWLAEDRVPAYRWVRQGGRDYVWLATAGQVALRLADDKTRLRLDFRMTMEPVCGTAGSPYVLQGNIQVAEDVFRTQSLINHYGPWLASVLNPKPQDQGKANPS